jgi:hypothetical protein
MTGTRVLQKTHEPLTFSGSRSTAIHEDQSIIDEPYSRSFAKGKRGTSLVEFEQIVTLARATRVLDFNKQSKPFDYFISSNLARSWRDDVTGIARIGYALTAGRCLNS